MYSSRAGQVILSLLVSSFLLQDPSLLRDLAFLLGSHYPSLMETTRHLHPQREFQAHFPDRKHQEDRALYPLVSDLCPTPMPGTW